jgi:hypothetical protein
MRWDVNTRFILTLLRSFSVRVGFVSVLIGLSEAFFGLGDRFFLRLFYLSERRRKPLFKIDL